MKLLKTLSVCSLLLLFACPDKPVKPQKQLQGQIDCNANEMIVGLSGVGMTGRDPICPTWDKATSFKPAEWAARNAYVKKLEAYASTLENYIANHCASP